MATFPDEKKLLALTIAGEIILSDDPSNIMKEWRERFSISQALLAKDLELSSSVISDYESGRGKNPGTQFVRRFVQALFGIDKKTGKNLALNLAETQTTSSKGSWTSTNFLLQYLSNV